MEMATGNVCAVEIYLSSDGQMQELTIWLVVFLEVAQLALHEII